MNHLGTQRWLLVTGVLVLTTQLAFSQAPAAGKARTCPMGVVFVANAGGDGQTLSDQLDKTFEQNEVPYKIITFPWTAHLGRFTDFKDSKGQVIAGMHLAHQVMCFKKRCPHSRVILLGYSAGAGVVLAAAEHLPPGCVDRIILLGAAVACNQEVCQARRAAREGIDSFYSSQDNVLEFAESTADLLDIYKSPVRPAAGRVGFVQRCCADGTRIRQYGWTIYWDDKGHNGSHFGYLNTRFLLLNVVPLLKGDRPAVSYLRPPGVGTKVAPKRSR